MKNQMKLIRLFTLAVLTSTLLLFCCTTETSKEVEVSEEKARNYAISENEEANITIKLYENTKLPKNLNLKFKSRILRTSKINRGVSETIHKIFVPFDEAVRNYLRANTEYFTV